VTYSIESLGDLFSDDSLVKQKSILRQLRTAQRSLGQLNDDARGQTLVESLNGARSDTGIHFLNRKRGKRLLRTAKAAYHKLDKVKPFRSSDLARSPEADD
jgi:hypothetical protein